MSIKIFSIKAVEFEHGSLDPFGFDAHTDRLARKYIPFSGTIRKPIYLLFVSYVESLFRDGYLKPKSRRDKEDIRLRLEKLLVYAWTRRHGRLRSQGVIGNSIRHVNPFEGVGGNWVVQNCYRIYGSSAELLATDELVQAYLKANRSEIRLLQQFLERSGSLERNRTFVDDLLRKLAKRRTSLFCGQLVLGRQFRRKMLSKLKEILWEAEFSSQASLLYKIFNRPKSAPKFLDRVLVSKEYPFHSLNRWFSAFILAVEADLKYESSHHLWMKADALYGEIAAPRPPSRRPKPRCWFTQADGTYRKSRDFDASGWSALIRKAEQPREGSPFYSFRIFALESLLTELDSHAG
jgi:hypothetical protein